MIRTSSQGGCFRTGSFRLLLAGAALAVLACAGPEARGGAAGQEGSRIRPGTAFPAMTVQAGRKGASEPSPLDLSGDLGSRPILFFYLNPGHAISEQVLAEVSSFLAAETPGKIALHLVVMPDRAPAPVELRERLAGLGVEAPVILDEGRRIAEALGVTVVPSMALVDRDGILRFGGASSLEQNVLREITLG
jgi:hypothetical protein